MLSLVLSQTILMAMASTEVVSGEYSSQYFPYKLKIVSRRVSKSWPPSPRPNVPVQFKSPPPRAPPPPPPGY
ncbi:hypothetical protein WN943_002918 [Citrus x changshan-huyou]